MTEWRLIPGYSRYEACDDGRVRSAVTLKMMSPHMHYRGYLCLNLKPDVPSEKRRGMDYCRVHRLVAATFIPNPEAKPFVNHLDCNQVNNAVINLEWATVIENQEHARQMGRYHAASNPKRIRKLSPADVEECRRRRANGETYTVLARDFGLTPTNVKRALETGRVQRVSRPALGIVVNETVAGWIKWLHAEGYCRAACARIVGVGTMTAWRIIEGQRWRNAQPLPFTTLPIEAPVVVDSSDSENRLQPEQNQSAIRALKAEPDAK